MNWMHDFFHHYFWLKTYPITKAYHFTDQLRWKTKTCPLCFKERRRMELIQHKAVTRFWNPISDIWGRTSKRKGRQNTKNFKIHWEEQNSSHLFFPTLPIFKNMYKYLFLLWAIKRTCRMQNSFLCVIE